MRHANRTHILTCLLTTLLLAPTASAVQRSYAFCKGTKAYKEKTFVHREPTADWICQLAQEEPARPRCAAAQRSLCETDAGGDTATPGPHDVPRDAWYLAVSTTAGAPVRCQCGCFAPETRIATAGGVFAADELLQLALFIPVQPLVRANADALGAWRVGPELRGRNFTVGPEDKPLVVIQTANGQNIRLTDNHPVFVSKAAGTAILRADELSLGDELFDENGATVAITDLSSALLDASSPVINFAADSDLPLDHIVLAAGLQVGDLRFQQVINAEEIRIARRTSRDWLYLQELGG